MSINTLDTRMIAGSYFAGKVKGAILSYVAIDTVGISAGYGWDSTGNNTFSIGAFTKKTSGWVAGLLGSRVYFEFIGFELT